MICFYVPGTYNDVSKKEAIIMSDSREGSGDVDVQQNRTLFSLQVLMATCIRMGYRMGYSAARYRRPAAPG